MSMGMNPSLRSCLSCNRFSSWAVNVLSLMRVARDKVREKHGVELQPEVRFLGFPD